MQPKLLLNAHQIDILLHRLACQLIENHRDFSNAVLIGLQPRGIYLLDRLKQRLVEDYGRDNLTVGKLDITFFRDDFRRSSKPHAASSTEMNIPIEGKDIVFIDDVLYTGRSIRAALTAIESYGRPKSIELLTLIDRRFSRDLPIQPDYVGRQVDALQNDKVTVEWKATHETDAVYLLKDIL
ncbi:MAG: bifunctional pyr operon transcriptional regulator/uracil phosphoribosyltransferase PyrR [Flavobacteriaceae bacterium]|nr:bifunctional pyr operon transcriptional regulator/uracil phosphoribosyltransferase PyrR [Flavobacteriaceae bacterium]